MSRFNITVDNLRGLRQLRWSPSGVCLLVGPNGAGKTTLLFALKLLRAAFERNLPEAVRIVLGGSHGLKHRDALEDEPIEIAISIDELRWSVRLRPAGASVDYLAEESLYDGERLIFDRDGLGGLVFGDQSLKTDERMVLRAISDSQHQIPEVVRIADFLQSITVYHDPDLYQLRGGSNTAHNRHLHSRGHNALTMLRQWNQRRPDRSRYRFVLKGMQAAFPGMFEDLDFLEAGNTLAAQVYHRGTEIPVPLGNEANGVLSMLISLCNLAAADEGGVVAIDEPENALHPWAIRVFARRAEALARKKDLVVLLSTHSTVLLDHFDGTPEQVYVLDSEQWPGPTRLTELKDVHWLQQFRLGELYASGEITSNDARG